MENKNNYNKFLISNGISKETNIKRNEFNDKIWNNLSDNTKLNRMIEFSKGLFLVDDCWAKKKMTNRREKREFVSPTAKTKKMFRKIK